MSNEWLRLLFLVIIISFWLTCTYRGNIHIGGAPSQKLVCSTHGRSHTRSPGVSVMMRVDRQELPFSVIPLCQLLPSHLGPPRPTLSISLYVKGCLDCTIGVFYVSIQVEPFLLQDEVRTSMWSVANSSVDLMVAVSCCFTLQICLIITVAVLLMAQFHWHGVLCSAHKSCTHGHMSSKRGGRKRELVSAPWTSSKQFSQVLWRKAHNHLLLRARLLGSKRKLPPPACHLQLGLPSMVCCLRGMQSPGTVYTCNQVYKRSSPLHFLCNQCLQPLQK